MIGINLFNWLFILMSRSGGASAPAILQETGDYLLLESGDRILIE